MNQEWPGGLRRPNDDDNIASIEHLCQMARRRNAAMEHDFVRPPSSVDKLGWLCHVPHCHLYEHEHRRAITLADLIAGDPFPQSTEVEPTAALHAPTESNEKLDPHDFI